jgi:predicted nucleic-acid-binding protein
MKGLDTNVLVRLLVQDDRRQSSKANRYIEEAAAGGESCFLNTIVLCETVWVLESAYGYPKAMIVEALEKIVSITQFEIERKDAVWGALEDYKSSKADFSDCLIGRVNRGAGCDETASFDSAVTGLSGFHVL